VISMWKRSIQEEIYFSQLQFWPNT